MIVIYILYSKKKEFEIKVEFKIKNNILVIEVR